jgi:predicted TIM-barrel fold metal-dependent hydrolase
VLLGGLPDRVQVRVVDGNVLGEDVLMYASDYPHSECQFPNSVDNVLKWSSLKPDTKKKLLWDNAARFYKQT